MTAIDARMRWHLFLAVAVLGGASLALATINAAELGGWRALVAGLGTLDATPLETVRLLYAWLPRLVVALLAGAALAAAGAVMQQVLRNPIASPLTLGVAAGAQLALSVLTLAAPAALAAFAEPAAVAGGAGALGLVLLLTWRRDFEPVSVVLAGLVVSLYFGGINAGLLLFLEYDLEALLLWGSGALSQYGWGDAAFLAPRVAIVGVVLALLVRPLTLLTLDDASASGLGLSLQKARLLALAASVYVSAAVVSAVGIIGFVGLAAPALARQLGARTVRQRLISAPLIGAGLLLVTDQCVQLIDPYLAGVLPTGAVTAVIGAPVLLWLLREVRPGSPGGTWTSHPEVLGRPALRLAAIGAIALVAVGVALLVVHNGQAWQLQNPASVLLAQPWRPPRVAAAALAGLLLAVAGTLLQRLLRNPMASPEVLGISGGALAGITALVFWLPTASEGALVGAGTLGAIVTTAFLLAFARRSGATPERILLVGIAVKALFDGLIGLVAASGSPLWPRLLTWISGSTYGVEWPLVAFAGLGVAVLGPLTLALHRWLALLALGDEQAGARGLAIGRARFVLLVIAAVATTLATLLVGPLSFVGLMAPHIARLLGLRGPRMQLAGAAALGAAIMVSADWMGRTLLAPHEWPAGLAASFVGGIYFMWLLSRR